ncbi:hypothetical protein BsWGS_25374 [Bradybaena similaris]
MYRLLLILVILGSDSVILPPVMAVCPYDVSTCTCSGSQLLCTNLESIPPLVSDNSDGNITELTFSVSNLDHISSASLPANLQKLILNTVNINLISPNAFNSSATTLKSFSMIRYRYPELLPFAWINYPELPEALRNVESLTELRLSYVNITNWNLDVVEHVKKTLVDVVFSRVGFGFWPEWLTNFTLLRSLDVSRNQIADIPVDAFRNVENLNKLSLGSNKLANETNVNAALRPLIDTLEILDISLNLLPAIPKVVGGMAKLSKLDISENYIEEITSDRIPPQLKILDASYNAYLHTLNDNSFPMSSSLEVLNLSYSELRTISDLAFRGLQHLQELHLDHNGLTKVPLALTKLNNLNLLDLNGIWWQCPCPRDASLDKWYAPLNNSLNLSGQCKGGNSIELKYYLSNPCSGYNRHGFSSFLYIIAAIAMGAFLL